MSTFWLIEPEVPGDWNPHHSTVDRSVWPPHILTLQFDFDVFPRSDLITSFPCFLVTARLQQALEKEAFVGIDFDFAYLSKSYKYRELEATGVLPHELPHFSWLKVDGVAGKDDFGLTHNASLVVSTKALELLRKFNLTDCDIIPYETQKPSTST